MSKSVPNSMTAFARIEHREDWGTIAWEIRSVNHRYLELGLRMTDTLRELEMPLRERARNGLSRGKVDATLHLTLNREQEGIHVNTDQAARFIAAAEQVSAMIANPAPLSALEILDKPGVLEQREIDSDALKAAVLTLFDQALTQLTENRALEGGKLRDFILQRLDAIAVETTKVRQRLPEILAAHKHKLREKIADMVATVDADRLEQEVVIVAQKADVDEELDRLDAHLTEIRRVLSSGGPIGRRLDFLMQELNREANTLSSKSLATDTTQSAVELKVLIEQMREQIQNIE